MNAADFDRRVHEHLDARRDPLDDPAVCAFLATHPDRLAGFGRQCETVRWLRAAHAPTARPHRRPWRGVRWLVLTAAAAGLVAVAWPRAAPTPPSCILGADLYEVHARAFAAVQYAVHQPLMVAAHTSLETYENRSEGR